MPDYIALNRWYRRHPPLYALVEGATGYEAPPEPISGDIEALRRAFGMAGGLVTGASETDDEDLS